MNLAHKIRLNPTLEQEVYFRKASGLARLAYNWGLEQWNRLLDNGVDKVSYFSLKKQFNAIKHEQYPFVAEVTKCATEQPFSDLNDAFIRYEAIKSGKIKIITKDKPRKDGRPKGYPRFKAKKYSNNSFYLSNDQFIIEDNYIRLPKLGWVNMAEQLRFDGKIMSATISQDAGNWYVSVSVEFENEWIDNGQPEVGIDLGISKQVTLSDDIGSFENQRITKKHSRKIRKLNKELSRREAGSNRYNKTVLKLQKAHKKIRNQRQDYIHKITTSITKNYGIVGVEDLNVAGIARNRKLAKSILDVGLGEIKRQLEYKQHLNGSYIQIISRWFPSSKTCCECGWYNENLELSDRIFTCGGCGVISDRDTNAANNIKIEAIRLYSESFGTG